MKATLIFWGYFCPLAEANNWIDFGQRSPRLKADLKRKQFFSLEPFDISLKPEPAKLLLKTSGTHPADKDLVKRDLAADGVFQR